MQYTGLCVSSSLISLCDDFENIHIYLIVIIKSEVWNINHCLGLRYHKMICDFCLPMFLWCMQLMDPDKLMKNTDEKIFSQGCIDTDYNMVGVAVAMVIFTMHEKSCIDSHNARKFEKKFQNSVIHTSRNHSDEIAEVSQSWISLGIITMRHNYSERSFLQNWGRILILINIDFIKIYRHPIFKTDYSNDFSLKHICVHILCRFSETGIIMTSQRRCYARDPQNHAYILYNAWFVTSRFGTSLVNFGFIMYQNQINSCYKGSRGSVNAQGA